MMYQIGDLILHGAEGVCRVEAISKQAFSNLEQRLYYQLAPLYGRGSIFVPVEGRVFLRPLIDREQALHLLQQIPELPAEACRQANIRLLNESYQQQLEAHSCQGWLCLIKSVYAKRALCSDRGKRLGATDLRYLQQAEELLYGELACALETSKEAVRELVNQALEQEQLA